MINSASDYKCVNTTGLSGFISGDILPARDNRGDGSWRAMKYEDLLFLQEAKLERENPIYDSSFTKEQPKGRAFSKSVFEEVADLSGLLDSNLRIGNHRCCFIDNEWSIPTIGYSSDSISKDYVGAPSRYWLMKNNKVLSVSDIEDPTVSGMNLKGDNIRKAFYNIKKLSRIGIELEPSDWIVSYVLNGMTRTPTDENLVLHESYSNGLGSRHEMTSIQMTYSFGRYPNCSAAWMLWAGLWRKSGMTDQAFIATAFQCIVNNNGEVLFPLEYQQIVLNAIMRPAADFYTDHVDGFAFGYISGYPVLILDFKAEVNSLSWNWQPSQS